MAGKNQIPTETSCDVDIAGGAIMGASTARFLCDNNDFNGKILVVERDTTCEACSTTPAKASHLPDTTGR